MLRLKKAFVVSADRPAIEHIRQIQNPQHRKRILPDGRLYPGVALYYPLKSNGHTFEGSMERNVKMVKDQQASDNTGLVLFKDTEFVAVNKPPGVSSKKLIVSFAFLRACKQNCLYGAAKVCLASYFFNLLVSFYVVCLSIRHRTALVVAVAEGGPQCIARIAGIEGHLPGKSGCVKLPLRFDQEFESLPRDDRCEQEVRASIPCALHSGGEAAFTQWTVLRTTRSSVCTNQRDAKGNHCEANQFISVLILETELLVAKHQIRAHCAFGLGCPLEGDALYMQLLRGWQRTQQKHMSVADDRGCLKKRQKHGRPTHRDLALPLHVKQVQWRTLEGTGLPLLSVLLSRAPEERHRAGS
ncbi:hypothetical protein Emag_001835 [Eimeria magna]